MSPEYEIHPSIGDGGAGDQLWVPEGSRWKVEYEGAEPLARSPEANQMVWRIQFVLKYMSYWKPFSILWEEGDSEDQIEDLVGFTAERTAHAISEQLSSQGSKLRPEDLALRKNWHVRRELAGAWREWRAWRKKQKESTTGQTLFKGLKDGKA